MAIQCNVILLEIGLHPAEAHPIDLSLSKGCSLLPGQRWKKKRCFDKLSTNGTGQDSPEKL
jgi:hypothetical protein